ncbi:hypothetical protein ANCDUO_08297 [Ancylostoma duodenale]|uniref:Uncharacterized protein n=1 Tax=Ancylostoma duodenale TaxID=51022 RepID=A0A0C2CWU7_9BILA|nr:hypothetical protein ANCDUO_08297 [Ancylostoma duodenale]
MVKPIRLNTSDFAQYHGDIESPSEFDANKINIVLTLSIDGVKLKKLLRSEAWPIYLRLEGLPFKEKNNPEHNILAAIMFTSKTPSEALLYELFSRADVRQYVIRNSRLLPKPKRRHLTPSATNEEMLDETNEQMDDLPLPTPRLGHTAAEHESKPPIFNV